MQLWTGEIDISILNGELKLDEFEEKGSPYPFYEEWLKNTTCLKNFCLKKIIYYKYYMQ